MKLVELDRKEFTEYSANYPYSTFFQSPYWIDVKKDNGWKGTIVGFKEDDRIVAATVLLFKGVKFINKNMVYAPRGFLLDYSNTELLEEFVGELKEYLKEKNALFLKINPYVKYRERTVDGDIVPDTENDAVVDALKSLGFTHQGFYVTMDEKKDLEPRWLSVLELGDKSTDELFKAMRSTTRWSIRNSEKNCLRIIECKKDDLPDFKALMLHTAERRGFIDRPLSYYENIYEVMGKEDQVKILLVEIDFSGLLKKTEDEYESIKSRIETIRDNPKKQHEFQELSSQTESFEKRINDLKEYISQYGDKKIIAGGLYMLYGNQLVYLLGASYKEFMKFNSQYLLQWEMIKYARENNYQTFNFYGIDGDFSKESPNYGLFDFKRGFHAEVVELIGEFDLILDKTKYKLYTLLFKMYSTVKKLR